MEQLIPLEGVSLTGLQAKELMGLTVNSINELSDSDVADFNKFYDELYLRATRSLEVDTQRILSGFYKFPDGTTVNGKFNFNAKFVTLESSEYNAGSIDESIIGVTVQPYLSIYSALVINWVEFNVITAPVNSSSFEVSFINTLTGEKIYSQTFQKQLVKGVNRFTLLQSVTGIEYLKIQIEFTQSVSPAFDIPTIRPTTQRFYQNGEWITKDLSCECPFGNGTLAVYQTEPGLNIQLSGICSVARFIEYNVALFKFPLYYAIGKEFMKERITSDRINQYTVLTIDRANQLLALYEADYVNSLMSLRDINNVAEDFNCFSCRKPVSSSNLLP